MKNSIKILSLVIVIVISSISLVHANTIKILINEKEISSDAGVQLVNARTLVPIRVVIENLGGTVDWDNVSKEVTIKKDNLELIMQINNNTLRVKEAPDLSYAEKNIDQAPIIIENRTMVPVRFVAEELGYFVDWNASEMAVIINDVDFILDKIISRTGGRIQGNMLIVERDGNSYTFNIDKNILSNETDASDITGNKFAIDVIGAVGRVHGYSAFDVKYILDSPGLYNLSINDGVEIRENNGKVTTKINLIQKLKKGDLTDAYLKVDDRMLIFGAELVKKTGRANLELTIATSPMIINVDEKELQIIFPEDNGLTNNAYKSILSVIEAFLGKEEAEAFAKEYPVLIEKATRKFSVTFLNVELSGAEGVAVIVHKIKNNFFEYRPDVTEDIMSRFTQNIVLSEESVITFERDNINLDNAHTMGEQDRIFINNFFINVYQGIIDIGYTKEYLDNKVLIEINNKEIRYEIAQIFEGYNDIFEVASETVLSKYLTGEYKPRNADEINEFLKTYKYLAPDLYFTNAEERFEIIKNIFGIITPLEDVEYKEETDEFSGPKRYKDYKFKEGGYNNIIYIYKDNTGIYAVRTMYKDDCSVESPDDLVDLNSY